MRAIPPESSALPTLAAPSSEAHGAGCRPPQPRRSRSQARRRSPAPRRCRLNNQSPREDLTHHQLTVLDSFNAVKRARDLADKALRPWIVRHNKTSLWAGTCISRRERIDGAGIDSGGTNVGISIPHGRSFHFFWLHVVPFLRVRTYWAKLCVPRTKHSVSHARRGMMD